LNHNCPYCSANASIYIQGTDLNHQITPCVFDYYLCKKCKLIFIDPIPHNLSIYYETEYPPYTIPNTLDDLKISADFVSWRINFVQQYVKSGKILEVGPSYGAFAYAATRSGFLVDAIEMDSKCCEYINNNIPNAKAIHTSNVVEGISLLDEKYDAVVFWHNLEHLANPWATLEKASEHLTLGGIIIISTPNPDSLQFKIFKKYWVHLDAPRHLTLIPKNVLSEFLTKKGMQLQLITTTDPDGIALNNMGWIVSFAHILEPYKDSLFKKILYKLLTILISKLVRPIERSGSLGAAYTVVFKKI
jgi:2-polyprenyl-3-methyl-5-hydroxy-6-metoxy-1,4-benzoquinol methylase